MKSANPFLTESELSDGRRLGQRLSALERQIALLRRCQPSNGAAERARLLEELKRGAQPEPNWQYAPHHLFCDTRPVLAQVRHAVSTGMRSPELWLRRIDELYLEAELAEAVGTPHFRKLARRRYGHHEHEESARANQLATHWCSRRAGPCTEERIVSDNQQDPNSLIRRIHSELDRWNLSFRTQVSRNLASVAATGAETIFIASGRPLTPSESHRIAVHEVQGHALPRGRSRYQRHGLFGAGAAGCNDEEEGRALLIEVRENAMSDQRRRDLGLRHLLAVKGSQGQSWGQAVQFANESLDNWGASVDLVSRVHRGGGLFRESCYLLAFQQLERAFKNEPELESWFSAGRMTLGAIEALRPLGVLPRRSAC